MTGPGLLFIILGFILMIMIIANGLLSQGLLLTREQKIKMFLDEYEMMDKHEKSKFINEYFDNKNIKSICNAVIPINTPSY